MAFEQGDNALIIFDGQAVLHGVTPINKFHPRGYRASVVLYALEAMKNCYPFEQELEFARTERDKTESRLRPDAKTIGSVKRKVIE